MGDASLTDVAIRDALGVTAADEIGALAKDEITPSMLKWDVGGSPLSAAYHAKLGDDDDDD